MDNEIAKLDTNTEKKILDSARIVFHLKGYNGARMQEIADQAGINKAMLHYYFRDKNHLFESVFREAANRMFPKIMDLLDNDYQLFEKIERFVEGYITLLQENCFMPAFIINEINQNPERIKKFFIEQRIVPPQSFIQQIITAVESGEIKPIDPKQLMLNIISLCIFPLVGKPIVQTVLSMNDEQYNRMIDSRKKDVSNFIINAIKVN